MIRDTAQIANRAAEIDANGQAAGLGDRGGRTFAAALTAGWEWWSCGSDSTLVEPAAAAEDVARSDAASALHELLALTIRLGGSEEPALQCLGREKLAGHVENILGMRLDHDDGLLEGLRARGAPPAATAVAAWGRPAQAASAPDPGLRGHAEPAPRRGAAAAVRADPEGVAVGHRGGDSPKPDGEDAWG